MNGSACTLGKINIRCGYPIYLLFIYVLLEGALWFCVSSLLMPCPI